MVGVSSAVVADRGADIFGDFGEVANQIVDGLGGEGRIVGQGGIEVVDVGLVVLAVVDLHGLGVDERLEGGVVVGKRWKFVGHRGNLLDFDCTVRVERGAQQRVQG